MTEPNTQTTAAPEPVNQAKSYSYHDATEAFAVPGQDSLIDFIHPGTGRSWIEGETLEQVRARYPGAQIVSIAAHCAEKATRQDEPVTWSECTRERFWEMLEVLPPAFQGAGGFLVGEPWDHHALTGQPRFAAYQEKGGKYWEASRPMSIKEFRTRAR